MTTTVFARRWLLTCLVAAGLALALPRTARACGGLFCSSATPVNQAAERIIFSFDRPTKRVTAVVEILYQGPSEKFAWVLPVPGIPTVGVSTSAMLDRLQASTNPLYSIQRSWEGCKGASDRATAGSGGGNTSAPPGSPSPEGGPSVTVLASGTAGPYVYEVIKVDPAMSDPAMVAIMWLQTNGYDVGMLGPDVLRPYLREGLNLLAFKLTKTASTGSIRPIMLSYDDDYPMIPIRPTAVAANDNMGILVWILGASRAVTTNYKTLELNEAMLDWFQPQMSYNEVVNLAADEAGGQGFVTEMAAATGPRNVADTLYQERGAVQNFRLQADKMTPGQLVVAVVQTFAAFTMQGFGGPFGPPSRGGMRVALDGVADVLASQLKLPPGVKVADVMASPRCYFQEFQTPGTFYCDGKVAPMAFIDVSAFDRTAFLTELEKLVIQPLEKTSELFRAQPYMTRLYTTMSAREMTLDPNFDLNGDLPDVDNNHVLNLRYTEGCSGDTSGRWQATLRSGQVVHGTGNTWPYDAKAQRMPVNLRIVQMSTAGMGTVVADNTGAINKVLNAGKPGSGGCTLDPARNPRGLGGLMLLAVAGLMLLAWRRSGRRL